MKNKLSFKANKKLFLAIFISILLGSGIGILGTTNSDNFNKLLAKNTKLINEIEETNATITTSQKNLDVILSKKNNLTNKKLSLLENESKIKEEIKRLKRKEEKSLQKKEDIALLTNQPNFYSEDSKSNLDIKVWKIDNSSNYHFHNTCLKDSSNKMQQITLSEAKALGLSPCPKCL
ncbi:hypothetical protein JCM1393_23010 [Clostridium carnis]